VTRTQFRAAIVLGAVIRMATLPLPGTLDVVTWKIWSYVAAREGVGRLYGVGGSPPEHRLVSLHGAETTVDYPPLALAELGVAGRVYRWLNHGRYPDDARLIAAVKTPALLADAGVLAILYFSVRRLADEPRARWAAAAFWLNPAILLDGAILGYLDPLFVLPVVAGLVAAAFGWPVLAGMLSAAAFLTKPQAIVVAPALALAIWNSGDREGALRRAAAALAGAAVAGGFLLTPVLLAGALPNLLNAMGRLGAHDMLSGNACNLWWIVGYVMRAYYSMHDMGVWSAFTTPTRILAISRVVELGYPNPRIVGTLLTLAAFGWGLWTARRAGDLWMAAALAAFLVHAYATLSAQVHENHLMAAVPLLGLAAAGRRSYLPLLAAVSAIFALNLNLFYGVGEDVGYAIPRGLTIVDATVVVSVANCAALAWHALVLRVEACREPDEPTTTGCSTAAEHPRASAPA
jgi:hypothetical protein